MSDTYSYGVVFQPRFAPGLAITVDYFDIKIKDTISILGANNILTACYRPERPGRLAHRIERNPGNGSVVGRHGPCD